jgi:hypothetical protein
MDDLIYRIFSYAELFVAMMIWIFFVGAVIAGLEHVFFRMFPRKVQKADATAPTS